MSAPGPSAVWSRNNILHVSRSLVLTLLVSSLLVFLIELLARASFESTVQFFVEPYRPGWSAIALFALLIMAIDAVLGRTCLSILVVGPLFLGLALISHQKAYYLGD